MRTVMESGKIWRFADIVGLNADGIWFERTFLIRAIHAVGFETGLIITLMPVAMIMLNLTVTEAFFVEIGLVLFFLPYTMLFNWIYDYLRWIFAGRKRSAQ